MSPEKKAEEQKPFNLEESFNSAIIGIRDELQRAHASSLSITKYDDKELDITREGTLRRRLGNFVTPILNTARTYVGNYYMVRYPEKARHKKNSNEEILLGVSIQTYDNEQIQKEAIEVLNTAWKRAKKISGKKKTI